MVEMAATASNYKMEVVNANKTSTNNYKMEVVAAQEKKGDRKDKKERISEEKEIKEEEKPNATIREEKPLPRLPCSGSSWCNILCGAGAGIAGGVRAAGGGSLGGAGQQQHSEPPKSPKSPQFNGAFLSDEAGHVYENKTCSLQIPGYEFHQTNVEFLLDQTFEACRKGFEDQPTIVGEDDDKLFYVTEV